MYLNIIITLIFNFNFLQTVYGKCTVNPDFVTISTPEKGYLCSDFTTCQISALKNNTQYRGCKMVTDNPGKFAIGIINDTNTPYAIVKCLVNNGWAVGSACVLDREFTFITDTLTRLQQYVVLCTDSKNILQFPCEEQSQIQISEFADLSNYNFAQTGNATIFITTQTITCNSFCLEQIPTLVRSGGTTPNDIDPVKANMLRLYSFITPTNANDLKAYDVKYECSNAKVETWKIRLAVANTYTVLYLSLYDTTGTISSLDAGLSVSCNFAASLYFPTLKVSFISEIKTVKPNIYIYYRDGTNTVIFITPVNVSDSVKIPENLLTTKDYYLGCYIGDYAQVNRTTTRDRYYKEFTPFKFQIGSAFETKILYGNGKGIDGNDIEDQSDIKCDDAHYAQVINAPVSVQIGIIMVANFVIPYSKMVLTPSFPKNTSTVNLMYFQRSKTLKMAIYCIINSAVSTPFPVISGNRPFTKFFNIFPSFDHNFTLRSFVYGCVGEDMIETHIVCENCPSSIPLSGTDNGSYPYIIIPNTIRQDIVVSIICNGKASKYTCKTDTRVLNIIAYDYNDFNDTFMFYMEDDMFNCATKFISQSGSIRTEQRISMPTQLMIENTVYTTSDTKMMLKLIKGFKSYQGCCLIYTLSGLTCDGNWKKILVGNSYTVHWNRNLSEIYPNNELKCYSCVNYTTAPIRKCAEEHKVNAYIGYYITQPIVESVTCDDKKFVVNSPKPILKPDGKDYYKMSEINITLICCVRDKIISQNVRMKSCNENPPKVKILPEDKMLFAVGESISCATDMIDCISGLIFTISIIPEKGTPVIVNAASYEFVYNNVGNRVEIKCAAGILQIKEFDSRVVRVEQDPFNVTIIGVLPVLWYGRFLQCSAKGFPPPDIYWIQTNGSSLLRISDYFLLIGPWDFSGNYTVFCEAKNTRGIATANASFGIYNSRIRFYETSFIFYLTIPIITLLFIGLIFSSMILTFQEVFFGVPLFSSYKAKGMLIDTSVKSKKVEVKK